MVEQRTRLGDIEDDLMVGKALLVLTNRTTLLIKLKKATSRKADQIATHITRQLRGIPSAFIKTLTFVGDKTFAKHQKIARELQIDTYLPGPILRRIKAPSRTVFGSLGGSFPKVRTFVSKERIQTVEQYLNFRPVLKFDYLNPIQQTLKYHAVALIT